MDIFANISAGHYANSDPYPPREDRIGRAEYRRKQNDLDGKFRTDLKLWLGIADHPKADHLVELAWSYGHSSGLHEVADYAAELADLLR